MNQNIIFKDVFDKLKESTIKQRMAEQKSIKLSKELEEERKKSREDISCSICKDIIFEMTKYSHTLAEDAQAIRQMFMAKTDRIKLKDGLTYTIDDIGARIDRNKCYMKESLEKYNTCCKERKLPKPGIFVC